ncbi:MAG: DinB family protein [Candidatus Zixiibacteriota bacterium]
MKAKEFFPHWDRVRKELLVCLDKIPEKNLTWSPKTRMMSLGRLFCHIAPAIDFWMTEVIKDGGGYTELTLKNCPTKKKIREELDRSYSRIVTYLNQPARLLDKRHGYRKKHRFTAGWVMWHLLEHEVHHRAQIFSYMRMNGMAPPKI